MADGVGLLLLALLAAACGCALGLIRNENMVEDARPARLSDPLVALGSATPIKIMIAACRSIDAKKNSLVAVLVREVNGWFTGYSAGGSAAAVLGVCAVVGGKISADCPVMLTLNPVPSAK